MCANLEKIYFDNLALKPLGLAINRGAIDWSFLGDTLYN
jgi:hypothetical protein